MCWLQQPLDQNPSRLDDIPFLLEGFVNKASLAQLALREDALAVGGIATEANRGCKKQDIERHQDLQALVQSWDHGLRPEDYMDCLVACMGDI